MSFDYDGSEVNYDDFGDYDEENPNYDEYADYDEENPDYDDYGEDGEDVEGDTFEESKNIYEEDYETRPSFDAFNRIGAPGAILAPVIRDIRKATPKERFIEFTNSMALAIKDKYKNFLYDGDIAPLLSNIENVKNVGYKNPLGYILGYISIDKYGNINKDRINTIFDNLESINSEIAPTANITKPDVLRYARLWKNIKTKKY